MKVQNAKIKITDGTGNVTNLEYQIFPGISMRGKGLVSTYDDLLAIGHPEFGDIYMVDTGLENGRLYQYQALDYPNNMCDGKWEDLGVFRFYNGKPGDDAYTVWVKDQPEGSDVSKDAYYKATKGKDGYTPVKDKDYFDGKPGKDGYNGIAGTFKDGCTVLTKGQIVFNEAENSIYCWNGEFPHTVLPNSTPGSSGGIADNAWIRLSVPGYSKAEVDEKFQPKGNYQTSEDSYSKTEINNLFQLKGNYALRGECYTTAQADTRFQPKGNYAPAGNYALKGESYTKGESDNRYMSKAGQIFNTGAGQVRQKLRVNKNLKGKVVTVNSNNGWNQANRFDTVIIGFNNTSVITGNGFNELAYTVTDSYTDFWIYNKNFGDTITAGSQILNVAFLN